MKKLVLLMVLLFCTSVMQANATTWVQIDDNYYIDKDSIHYYINDNKAYDFDKKTFWVKNTTNGAYQDLEVVIKNKISYGLSQYIIDFSNNSIATKSGATYDDNGKVLTLYNYQDYELDWQSIIPSSNASYWSDFVKHPRKLQKIYKMQNM